VLLAVADVPSSPEIGGLLYKASSDKDNFSDRWLSRAMFIAATRHKAGFLTEYKSDPNAVPASALPISLRMGTTKPDWRTPDSSSLSADWKEMQVPGNWEARGLPEFDGVVWFTRAVDVPQSAAAATLTLGRLGNVAEVWVNGLSVNQVPFTPQAAPGGGAGAAQGRGRGGAGQASAGGRGNLPYELPAATLKPGVNTITVRITNNRNEGGFLGTPETMAVQAGDTRIPLAGAWRYRVERQTNAGALYAKPGELAAHLAFASAPASAAGTLPEPAVRSAPDVVIRLSVKPGEMQFDKSELTVAPGQLVEIVFTNPDSMQHNFVLGVPDSLKIIGPAADDLARSPAGVAEQYVPKIPQVLFYTRLVEPGETLTVQFRAPTQAGDYTYVCTFPGHWRIMNGVLHVVAPQGRGRGGA
jgi:azurin